MKNGTISKSKTQLIMSGGDEYPGYRLAFTIVGNQMYVHDTSGANFFMNPQDVVDLIEFAEEHLKRDVRFE